jgi:transposase
VVNWCGKKDDSLSLWLQQLKQRQHVSKVTVALVNKMARIVFVVMSRGQAFDMNKACKLAA